MSNEIYLDNAATTRIDDEVKDAMAEVADVYGNPSSIHKMGVAAHDLIMRSRKTVAEYLNCSPDNIVFTSGGSESNATVLRTVDSGWLGFDTFYSAVEHESVIENAAGYERYEIPVGSDGRVMPDELEKQLRFLHNEPALVAVMAANNEISCFNDTPSLAKVVQASNDKSLFHVDCVQAATYCRLDVQKLGCDTLSISGHKIHAPKGIGVLYVRDKDSIYPLIAGSVFQEHGLRGGTENVQGIVGLAKAIEVLDRDWDEIQAHNLCIKTVFYDVLCREAARLGYRDAMHLNGFHPSLPGKIISLRFDGVDAQTLVLALSAKGIYISAGSACNAHSSAGSRVLRAIGLDEVQAHSTVRVSFSKYNTEEEVRSAAIQMAATVNMLRSLAGGGSE